MPRVTAPAESEWSDMMNATGHGIDRWRDLAREVGGKIGRSSNAVAFLLGAGASRSSGGPDTAQVKDAFVAAAGARLAGTNLMAAIGLIDEEEKQEILAPLFRDVTPGPGYHALAALAAYRQVVVLNLNWDGAMADAARRRGVLQSTFDIKADPSTWPSLSDPSKPGLHDVHLHGMLGQECRFGTLETLSFTDAEQGLLVEHGLAGLLVCVGASLDGEQDLPALFKLHQAQRDATRLNDHWYFLRGEEPEDGIDRFRKAVTFASPLTTVKAPDIDFDQVALTIVDAAVAGATAPGSTHGA